MPNDNIPVPRFYYDPAHDIYDGKPWTEQDIIDLRASLTHGSTIEMAAGELCRAGSGRRREAQGGRARPEVAA